MRNSSGAPVSPPRDQVQSGLAEMRPRLLDQRDVRPVALAELVTQARGKFEAAGTTTDDTIRCSVPRRGKRAFASTVDVTEGPSAVAPSLRSSAMLPPISSLRVANRCTPPRIV